MAFDGITVAGLCSELQDTIGGGRIYKIAQTDKNELVITVRPSAEKGGGQVRLYLCAAPSLPLVYLTRTSRQAPLQAPAFCMLLRKHLQNGRIVSVTQPGLERILRFEVEHRNEMGDLCTHYLVVEIMGKLSNIIFLDDKEMIVDSIRHVSSLVSSVREVLPGRTYFIPDTQSKKDPLSETYEGFLSVLAEGHMEVAKLLLRSYTGFSTVAALELAHRARLTQDRSAALLSAAEKDSLWQEFETLVSQIKDRTFTPVMYCRRGEGQSAGAPVEFSLITLSHYADCSEVAYQSPSALLEDFYARKNLYTRIRQRSADLRHIVQTILERDIHKYDLQCRLIKDTEKRDKYKVYGELLNAYGNSVPAGAKSCVLDNNYTGQKITVPLDPTLTPQQNAQKYFARYGKLKRTEEALTGQIAETEADREQLESILTSIDLAVSEADLHQIRRELSDYGFAQKKAAVKKGAKRESKAAPYEYLSSAGFTMYVGRNNYQNEELDFKIANGGDWWFHVKGATGSHVIVRTMGKEVPDRTFEEAGALAAWYSSARKSPKVEVAYTQRRNLKMKNGGKPGFVIYHTNYSLMAVPDISKLKRVR